MGSGNELFAETVSLCRRLECGSVVEYLPRMCKTWASSLLKEEKAIEMDLRKVYSSLNPSPGHQRIPGISSLSLSEFLLSVLVQLCLLRQHHINFSGKKIFCCKCKANLNGRGEGGLCQRQVASPRNWRFLLRLWCALSPPKRGSSVSTQMRPSP